MTDSPAYRLPIDTKEQPILDRVLVIRDHLSLLKQDRSTYVKAADVEKYYNQVIEQVGRLNKIRETKREEQNRLDTVLDDCFQLISLFFLTIGRNSEAPAVYSAVSTVKRLLDHLKEAGFYSPKDLSSIETNIDKWQNSIERGRDTHSPILLTLLEARITVCKATLHELKRSLSRLSPQMMGTYEKLVSILRSLSACNTRTRVSSRMCVVRYDQTSNVRRSSLRKRCAILRRSFWKSNPSCMNSRSHTLGRARNKSTPSALRSSHYRRVMYRMEILSSRLCWRVALSG